MLAKSKLLPPVAPAPFIVCASSINNIQFFFDSNAVITSLSFSSNSPLYFEPASKLPISNPHTSKFCINFGTVFSLIRVASPSAIAVLPTPGSPTISTLLLKRFAKTVTISSSSVALPITGSSWSSFASWLILIQCSSRISFACSIGMPCVVFISYVCCQWLTNSCLVTPCFNIK